MSLQETVRGFFRPSAWVVDPEPSTFAPRGTLTNKDMDPTPPHMRTWTTRDYVAYWIASSFNISAWEIASSMLATGLSWRQALVCIAVGHCIISVPILLNGIIGARLHVPFPVLVRSSFGYWFSYFAVVSRVALSMFWFGIQSYSGGECVYQMLKAIWPSIQNLPNHLPESSHVTTVSMLCFFLYMLIQFPFMIISPQRVKWFFLFKAVVSPAACIAMMIWAFVRVPVSQSLGNKHTALSGSELHWTYMSAMNSAIGIWLTLAVNIADFTRYAKSPRSQMVQIAIIPPVFTFIGFIGIVVTAAGQVLYGQILWDPTTLINQWDNRAAAFFASFAFAVGTIGTNIASNSLSAANDMTVLFPRYINIRRGQVLCCVIGGWALVPWEILASAPGFLNFMSGYTVFLSPFASILITDYWLVHRGRVSVPAMYDPNGIYRYLGGFNWRAIISLLLTVTPCLPGLANAVNTGVDVGNAIRLYQISSLYGFFTTMFVYYALSKFFPDHKTFISEAILPEGPRVKGATDEESASSWHEVGIDEKKDGVEIEEVHL
ncbi:NCS1 nucleoside transporter family [Peniophora sp. CONT]|nr:NCS1 nucleoside transporter family [Peniophora sp. CONT]